MLLGLLKDIAITALVIIINHFIYGIEDIIAYDFIIGFLSENKATFLTSGILGSGALLIFTSIEGLGLYKITYGLSKIFVRLSQFLITFLSIINIAFYVVIGMNLIHDSGYYLLLILLVILFSSCWALRIIDFNYHTKNAIMPVAILTVLSVVLVGYIWPLSGF